MTRPNPIASLLILALAGSPAFAGQAEDECLQLIAATQELAAAMPAADLSRRFAEHELQTARMEMDSGEADDCPDFIERARHIIATRPYVLRPGETLGVQPH